MIIPAIDIQDGAVVRFVQGKRDKKIYSRDPVKTARHWVKQGAEFLHVVDLDGAFSGTPKNIEIAAAIASSVDVPVEFGGGIRSIEAIKKVLDLGFSRVVLGTRAAQDRGFLQKAVKTFKDKIIIGVDAKAENVMIQGWKASSKGINLLEFVCDLRKLGLKELIYTDTLKDGTLKGPNIKGIKALLKASGMKVIGSGGVSSLEDIHKLKSLEKDGLSGIIIGKALYEGRFTLPQAIKFS